MIEGCFSRTYKRFLDYQRQATPARIFIAQFLTVKTRGNGDASRSFGP